MFTDLQRILNCLSAARLKLLRERARDASTSPRAYPILVILSVEGLGAPRDFDGRAAPVVRKIILEILQVLGLATTREALRKLLNTLHAARLIEKNGSYVRLSRTLLEEVVNSDLVAAGVDGKSSVANPSIPLTPKADPTLDQIMGLLAALQFPMGK